MKCSRVQDRLMAYHDGELSVSRKRNMEKHLSECEECARMLEQLVKADRAVDKAGIPDIPGADDRYWESFTSRVLDRVEEDAATRVSLPEKRSRSLFPLFQMPPMEFPRLVPALSIALVVVVSAGVLLKVGRVAPVPEATMPVSATGERAVQKPVYREQAAEERKRKDDTARLLEQETDNLGRRSPSDTDPTPKDITVPQPVKKSEIPVLETTGPGRLAGKLTSSSSEPVISSVLPEEAIAAAPVQEEQVSLDKVAKVDLNLKAAAMADEPEKQTEQADLDDAASPAEVEIAATLEPAREVVPRKEMAAPAPDVTPAEPATSDEMTPTEVVAAETVVAKLSAKASEPPIIEEAASVAAPEAASQPVTDALTGKRAEPQPEPQPEPAQARAGIMETVPTDTEVSSFAKPDVQAPSPAPAAEGTVTSTTQPSLYRVPREQLDHASRLAEVRKYWESEQILKDLLSRNPPSPVFEEASILMVDVLSNQNRVVEAQQVLDDAKLQFPASDLVQGYILEPGSTTVPVR